MSFICISMEMVIRVKIEAWPLVELAAHSGREARTWPNGAQWGCNRSGPPPRPLAVDGHGMGY